MKNDIILTLYSLPQTVFTLKELSLLFPEISYPNLKNRIHYFVQVGKLQAVRKGIFAKAGFNLLELANKLYTPSYISLETVLQKEGLIFQISDTVSAVSYLTREVTVENHLISYHRVGDSILTEKLGVDRKNTYAIASKERAFLDAIYLYKDYYFDNLLPLDWNKVADLKSLYHSQALEKRVDKYYKDFKVSYAQ
jgi:hypothetical protein